MADLHHHIRHHGLDDCGVCALATALNVTWERARDAMFDDGLKHLSYATSGHDIQRGAFHLGWKSVYLRMRPLREDKTWRDIPLKPGQIAIVKVQYADARAAHWVVFDQGIVWDSNFDTPWHAPDYPYKPLSFLIFEPEEF